MPRKLFAKTRRYGIFETKSKTWQRNPYKSHLDHGDPAAYEMDRDEAEKHARGYANLNPDLRFIVKPRR